MTRTGRQLTVAVRRAAILADARWRLWKVATAEHARRLASPRGQSTVEYALILAMISIPLALLTLAALRTLLTAVVAKIVEEFTDGP